MHALLNGYGPIGAIIAAVPPLMLAAVTDLTVQVLRHALAPTSARSSARHEPLVVSAADVAVPLDLEETEPERALTATAPAMTPAVAIAPTTSRPVSVQIPTAVSARTRTEADHRARARDNDRSHELVLVQSRTESLVMHGARQVIVVAFSDEAQRADRLAIRMGAVAQVHGVKVAYRVRVARDSCYVDDDHAPQPKPLQR